MTHLLDNGRVLTHPFIIGELALGSLRQTLVASTAEVLHLIEHHSLFGNGIGYVDAHLLAAVKLMPGSTLWTLDKRLLVAANRLELGAGLLH